MQYEKPDMEIMLFKNEDVVRTSNTPGYKPGGDYDDADFV